MYPVRPVLTRGFTLIELLIVITISSLAVALVGGLGVQEYRKYQVKAEQLELKNFMRQVSHLAFIHEIPLTLKSSEQSLSLIAAKKGQITKTQFDHIRLQNAEIKLNRQGAFSVNSLTYKVKEKTYQINLSELAQ